MGHKGRSAARGSEQLRQTEKARGRRLQESGPHRSRCWRVSPVAQAAGQASPARLVTRHSTPSRGAVSRRERQSRTLSTVLAAAAGESMRSAVAAGASGAAHASSSSNATSTPRGSRDILGHCAQAARAARGPFETRNVS